MTANTTSLIVELSKRFDYVLNRPIEDSDFRPPIHKLPIELMGEIFTKYIEDEGGRLIFSSALTATLDSSSNPFTLGHVCKHWMNITLSMATLWSSIVVYKPNMSQVPLVRLWLERANDRPLSLSLFEFGDDRDIENLATEQVLLLFVERVHRWQHINFQFNSPRSALLLNLPEDIPCMLETAKLVPSRWDCDEDHVYANNVWRALHSSPALRQTYWANDYVPSHAPWEQLTDIQIGMIQQDTLLEILRACQRLVVLNVGGLLRSDTMASSSFVTLPALHTLKFSAHGSDPKLLFQSLILPALTCLDIAQLLDPEIPRIPNDLDDLLNRSCCQLRKLVFLDTTLEEKGVIEYLALPSLQTLHELQLQTSVTDITIEALTIAPTRTKSYVLPHLKRIDLWSSCTSDRMVSAMVTSRLHNLEVFMISMDVTKDPCVYDVAFLKTLRDLGHDIVVSFF